MEFNTVSYLNQNSNYFMNLMARQPKRNHKALSCLCIYLDYTFGMHGCSINANTECGRQNFRRSILRYVRMKSVFGPYSEKMKHHNDFDK